MSSFLDGLDLSQLEAYLSGSAKASASGNEAEGRYLNARDAIKAQMYGTASNAATAGNTNALNTAKFTTSLPSQGASEAVRGSLIQNTQDAGIDLSNSHATQTGGFTGGTRPSSFTPETRAAGGDLIKHGQSLIADPGSFAPPVQAATMPTLSDEPKAGFWGQAASAGATAASLLKALTGGQGGAPSGGDLSKIVDWLKHFGGGSPGGNTGQPTGDFTNNLDNPPTDDGYGQDPNQQYGEPDPIPETSGRALGPDGQPLPVDPETDYSQLPGYGTATGGSGGGNWWDE